MLNKSKTQFFSNKRLSDGPWQMFERDFARLLMQKGFDDVRVVGGSGDMGADIIGMINDELWVFQCKHSKNYRPPINAIQEAVNAAEIYGADRIGVVISTYPNESFNREIKRFEQRGLTIDVFGPKKISDLCTDAPEYNHKRKNLRVYQQRVFDDSYNSLIDTGKAQVIMATGLGKTVVMSEIAACLYDEDKLETGSILVLAHTRELVKQLLLGFWAQLPKWVHTHILMGGEFPSYFDGITFATIQSVIECIDKLPKFDAIFIDEAHHIGATSFLNIIDSINPQYISGFTATPWRGDGFDIGDILGSPVGMVGISEGLAQGYLSDIDYRLIADDLDWDFVQQKSQYRYSLKQLNKKLLIPARDDKAAKIIATEFINEKRNSAIIFSPGINHATDFAGWLRHAGLSAEVITSDQSNREQEVLMSRFKAADFQIAVTVDMFNEGVDVPDVDMVVFLRATHSRRIFIQQLGRGLRISSNKDKVVVLDFVSDLRRMSMVLELDKSVKSLQVEKLGLGNRLVEFSDQNAGTFLKEWLLDQADLLNREGDAKLEIPEFEFPNPDQS
jgi:superfamily II DNA or RNA helicase